MKLNKFLSMQKRLRYQEEDLTKVIALVEGGNVDVSYPGQTSVDLLRVLKRAKLENSALRQIVDETLCDFEIPVAKSMDWLGVQE